MSKFIVANVVFALALTAAGSVLAADTTPSPSPAPQSPAPSSAPAAQAATVASQGTASHTAKKPSPSDVICKTDTGTGSRVGGAKICMTRADWRMREN